MRTISPTDFDSIFPEKLRELFHIISREGFCLTLVGGSVRDYLLTGEPGTDLDFEIRHTFEFRANDWQKKIEKLGDRLEKIYSYSIEKLPFSIFRIKIEGYEVELSSPRLEKYSYQEVYKHSDFEVELISNLSYGESFKRRDFTINAIGIEFGQIGDKEEFKLIDPYKGVADLEKRTLRHCGEDFYKDPVRFLRAVRFSLKYDLTLDISLKEELSKINLENLTPYYFFSEAFKSHFFLFCKRFFKWVLENKTPLSNDLKVLSYLEKINPIKIEGSKEEVLLYLASQNASLSELESFQLYAALKTTFLNSILQLKERVDTLNEIGLEKILNKVSNLDFENENVSDDLKLLFFIQNNRELSQEYKKYLKENETVELSNFLSKTPDILDLNDEQTSLRKSAKNEWKRYLPLYFFIKNELAK